MVSTALYLILINLVLLFGIALVRQESPFDIGVLCFLLVGTAIALLTAAVMTHASPLQALSGLAENLAPIVVAGGGAALALLALVAGPRGTSRRS